eukprot:361981-Chlamydomonas_euryale.AAC.6
MLAAAIEGGRRKLDLIKGIDTSEEMDLIKGFDQGTSELNRLNPAAVGVSAFRPPYFQPWLPPPPATAGSSGQEAGGSHCGRRAARCVGLYKGQGVPGACEVSPGGEEGVTCACEGTGEGGGVKVKAYQVRVRSVREERRELPVRVRVRGRAGE